jgi:hypothetical protein
MKTLIAYPAVLRAEAYHQNTTGEVFGPLWPFIPRADAHLPECTDATILAPGETLDVYVRKLARGSVVEEPELQAGEYYPRMWRGSDAIDKYGEGIPRVEDTPYFGPFIQSLQHLESLFNDLADLFHVVDPGMDDNLKTHGNAIRDLIILASTEVEAQWRGVLEANGIQKERYSTADYVKLLGAQRLNWYAVKLVRYPRLRPLAPFKSWNAGQPTQSLEWYDAYNKVKHDREKNFRDAALMHAIAAVAACVVMLEAQFGRAALKRHQLKPMFDFYERPTWHPKEWYYSPGRAHGWGQKQHPF